MKPGHPRRAAVALITTLATLAGCDTPLRESQSLSMVGQHDRAVAVLAEAIAKDPGNHALLAAQARERELAIAQLTYSAEAARASGRAAAARQILERIDAIDPHDERGARLRAELARDEAHAQALAQATQLLASGDADGAAARVQQVLLESPGLPAAQALQRRIAEHRPSDPPPAPSLGSAFQKPITLEFHEAPLHTVFDSLSRASGLNFVFDKDVRGDTKVTILLRDVTLDDALRTILSTYQLDRQVLNAHTVFVYPDSPAKQREHQELVTRSFYLANADVKQAEKLVRTMAKSRDVYVDERLNLLIVRDTPEVVRLVDRLIASIDLAEPEVMLEVQVMEVGSNLLDTLGMEWPSTVDVGVNVNPVGSVVGSASTSGQVNLSQWRNFTASVANPALVAHLLSETGTTNLLANPKLRARNHEKARVQIGEKLPVFTTTSTANVGVSTTVTYVDTGLKLEVEPSVQLDGDVVMKVNLEVTNLINSVTGPEGAIAYDVGTRTATTSLRVHDGETQILAGLINDQDSKSIQGLPGLSELPILGRLFGVHTDTRNKSEIVLLITPRVVRNIGLPDASVLEVPSGTDASPGAGSRRLHDVGRVAVPMARTRPVRAGAAAPASPAEPEPPVAAPDGSAVLALSGPPRVAAGEAITVALQNRSEGTLSGTLQFDPAVFALASAPGGTDGRFAFQAPPHGQQLVVLRASRDAGGKTSTVTVNDLSYVGPNGESLPTRVDGTVDVAIGSGR
jgi:general secretion pathway protein D